MKRNRMELIEELRKYTSKQELDWMLEQPTANLRAFLAWHESSDEDKAPRPALMELPEAYPEGYMGKLSGFPVYVVEEVPDGFLAKMGLSRKTKKKSLFKFWL